jgi:hypothetical protein
VGSETSGSKTWGVALGVIALGALAAYGALALKRRAARGTIMEAAPLACVFAPGDERAYQLRTSIDVSMDLARLGASGGKSATTGMDVEGRLALRALRVEPGGTAVVAMRLADARVAARGTAGPAEGGQAALGRPWLVRVGPDCAFRDVGYPSDLDPATLRFVETVLQEVEVVMAPDRTDVRWQRTQHDGLGTYFAVYERMPGRERAVHRTRGAYTQLWSVAQTSGPAPAMKPQVFLRRSATDFTMDEAGRWVEALTSDEDFTIATSARQPIADVHLTARLSPTDPRATGLADVSEQGVTWRSAGSPPVAGANETPAADPAVLAMPLDQVLGKVRDLLLSNANGAVGQGSDLLRDVIRHDPKTAPALYDGLLAKRIDDVLAPTVFLALQKAGTKEAEGVLVRAMNEDAMGVANRLRAVSALPDVPHPTHATLDALQAASVRTGPTESSDDRTVRISATYAIGTLEKRARGRDVALAEEARDAIRAKLKTATKDDLGAALSAVGNSGDGELLADLEPHLASTDPLERREAIQALAAMPPDRDADEFAPTFDGESSPKLRAMLADGYAAQSRAAGVAPPDAVVSAAMTRLGTEGDPGVRVKLIDLLGLAAGARPDVRAALAAQFAAESDPRIQVAIGKYVPAEQLP